MVYNSEEVKDPSFIILEDDILKKMVFKKSDGSTLVIPLADITDVEALKSALSGTYVQTPDGEVTVAGTIVTADAEDYVAPVAGKNLFDPEVAQADSFWSGGAAPISLAGWYASEPIPVTPGQVVSVNNARAVEYHKADLSPVSGGYNDNPSEGPLTLTIPALTAFLGVNVSPANLNSIQVEISPEVTAFEPFGRYVDRLLLAGDFADRAAADVPPLRELGGVAVHRDGDTLLVRSRFDATRDLLLPIDLSSGVNDAVRFVNDGYAHVSLTPTGTRDAQVWPSPASGVATSIHDSTDDNCPFQAGWSYIGGNHGWSGGSQITAAAHGKTAADLGSQWTDGTRTYTLLQVIDANTLLFGNQYSVSGGVVTGSVVLPAATLTHVSGATNTANVPVSGGAVNAQLTPGNINQSVTVSLDGKLLADDQKSYGQVLTIVERYDIYSYKSFIDTARANIGVSIWTLLSTLGLFARVSNTYRITPGQVVMAQRFTAVEASTLSMGVTQMYPLEIPAGGSLKQFMAGVGTVGGVDFSTLANLAGLAVTTDITPANALDALTPAHRMLQFAYSSGGAAQYGVSLGLLPLDDARPSQRVKNAVTKSWFISSIHKNYPQIAWTKSLAAGATLAGAAYRRYVAPPDTPVALVVSDGTNDWVIIDRIGTTSAAAMAAPDLLGRRLQQAGKPSIVVAEKVTGEGVAYSVAVTPGYGMWQAIEDRLPTGYIPGAAATVGEVFVAQQGLVSSVALTGSYQILYMWYIDLGVDVPVDQVSLNVTVLGTGNLRTGAYGHDPETGRPILTAPIADFGLMDITGTGVKDRTFSRLVLPRGFWFGLVWQTTNTTAPTISVLSQAHDRGPLWVGSSSAAMTGSRLGYYNTGVSGALGALSTPLVHQINPPLVAFKRAS